MELRGNFFAAIKNDEHIKLSLEADEAPFMLPLFSLSGFDTVIEEYRKTTLTNLWQQTDDGDMSEVMQKAYSVSANAALHAAIDDGDKVFKQTTHAVLPHFAYGADDAAYSAAHEQLDSPRMSRASRT